MAAREVVIYTTMFCPYCHSAKALLAGKGIAFHEIAVDGDRAARRAMSERAGGRTSVPQIFFGDKHLGGCDDLHALDAAGGLETLLGAEISHAQDLRRRDLRRQDRLSMILFTLACDTGHRFESWFRGNDAFDEQVAGGLVACPTCRSTQVAKTIMAPAVLGTRAELEAPPGIRAGEGAVALLDERRVEVRAMLKTLREDDPRRGTRCRRMFSRRGASDA